MFKVSGTLTNVRPPSSTEPQLETTSTNGNMRLNSLAAEVIGVSDGDYLAVISGETEVDGEVVKKFGLVKGYASEKGNYGAKLGSANKKGGGNLNFSSSNAWDRLGGNEEELMVYDVAETPIYVNDEGEEVSSDDPDATAVYMLEFNSSKPKQERKSGEED